MSFLQRTLGRLPSLFEDAPLPSRWLAHPPGGTQLFRFLDQPAPPHPQRLRLLTWNIHYGYGPIMDHGRGQSRAQVIQNLESIAHCIRKWKPDIVALQEVDRGALRSHHIDQLEWIARAANMPWAAWSPTWDAGWVPYPGRNPKRQIGQVCSGQATLSRFPLGQTRRHPLPQPPSRSTITNLFYLHRCLLEVQVSLGHRQLLTIFNAHLEAFDFSNREEHAQIAAGLIGRAGSDVVLLGDMNSVPPEATTRHGFVDEPDTDMRQDTTISILRGIPGIWEVAENPNPISDESNWHTFPAHAPNRRLDYIFCGQGMTCSSASPHTVMPPISDHLPILAEVRLSSPSP